MFIFFFQNTLFACALISIQFVATIFSLPVTTTLLSEIEDSSRTALSTLDPDITTEITIDEEEQLILDVDQVVVGFKFSMDPEQFNKISKRQTSDETPDEPSEETSTISFKALEDSFGGLNEASTEKPRPPERKIGVYYLLDWNSFFELDDQLGTRVNLRIQPKLGNPARFISVTVP